MDNLIIVKNIKKKFQKKGISAEKIITEGQSKTREEMLKKYNQIDIALDPFPYSGITTSLEANWMGVPLLTKEGNNFYSRIGTSINKNLDMEDWIANNEKDYILKAISKASDLKKLFQTKKELRNNFYRDIYEFSSNLINVIDKNIMIKSESVELTGELSPSFLKKLFSKIPLIKYYSL